MANCGQTKNTNSDDLHHLVPRFTPVTNQQQKSDVAFAADLIEALK